MSINDVFDNSVDLYPSSVLVDTLENIQSDFDTRSDFEAAGLRVSLDTARWSARQNPGIADRYCRELGWAPRDLAVMMVMQCAISSVTSGEFVSARGVLTLQGHGLQLVIERCLEMLVESGRITPAIADIERRELAADIEETVPLCIQGGNPERS